MKKGKWNYTEDVEWRVILVTLHAVEKPPMHWQNAFVGEERQIVEVTHNGRPFYIDNADGSGILKIEAGGGPGSMSRHVEGFDFILEVGEDHWQLWNPTICKQIDAKVDAWQLENYPEHYEDMQNLKRHWENSPWNPKNIANAAKKN